MSPISSQSPAGSDGVRIEAFNLRWREDCLDLLSSLTPEHFVVSDHPEFASFMDDLPGPYWVVLEGDRLVGCGGVALEPGGLTATLCWGMVAKSHQGRGIGKRLTEHRIQAAKGLGPRVRWLQINTSQKVEGFYATLGFEEIDRHPRAFGPDLDHVHMRRGL